MENLSYVISFLNENEGALMVTITFVYVIATCFICGANICAAKASKKQLAETKRQFEEDNRPSITYEMFFENRTYYGLRFTNHGKRVATNVSISLQKEFVDSLTESVFADFLKKLDGKEFLLGVGQSYSIYFGGASFRNNIEKMPIEGTISYRDGRKNYVEAIYLDFNLYPPFFSTTTNEDKLIKKLSEQNNELELLRKEIVVLRQLKGSKRKCKKGHR